MLGSARELADGAARGASLLAELDEGGAVILRRHLLPSMCMPFKR